MGRAQLLLLAVRGRLRRPGQCSCNITKITLNFTVFLIWLLLSKPFIAAYKINALDLL